MARWVRSLVSALMVFGAVAPATPAEFERPPTFAAAKILGAKLGGPNYAVASRATCDGYLRDYALSTSYGPLNVGGDQLLFARIKELGALDALQKISGSQKFGDALLHAGLRPAEFVGNLVSAPGATVSNTMAGVSNLLGGIVAGVSNAGKSQDPFLDSVSGASAARRQIAFDFGVDPYTDYKPLADELDALSRAAALGGLTVTAALFAVPGAAGAIVSGVSTAHTLSERVRDNSAAQLLDLNRATLTQVGVSSPVIELLLANRNFTPVDVTAFADALARLGPIRDADAIAARAAGAPTREAAYFIRRSMEMVAAMQDRSHAITGFAALGEATFPLATTKDGGVAGVFALDCLSWTSESAAIFTMMTDGAKAAHLDGPKTLTLSGGATALTKARLKALGWSVREGAGR